MLGPTAIVTAECIACTRMLFVAGSALVSGIRQALAVHSLQVLASVAVARPAEVSPQHFHL